MFGSENLFFCLFSLAFLKLSHCHWKGKEQTCGISAFCLACSNGLNLMCYIRQRDCTAPLGFGPWTRREYKRTSLFLLLLFFWRSSLGPLDTDLRITLPKWGVACWQHFHVFWLSSSRWISFILHIETELFVINLCKCTTKLSYMSPRVCFLLQVTSPFTKPETKRKKNHLSACIHVCKNILNE